MKRNAEFAVEADLCATFLAWLREFAKDWTAYPETHGWDILLAHADGTQIGVQAKLKFNMKVLAQAVGEWYSVERGAGPDYRAVLVPSGEGVDSILAPLGLGLIQMRKPAGAPAPYDCSAYPLSKTGSWRSWHYHNPDSRLDLPKYVPDVVAGAAGPTALTRWKIAALEIAATLDLRGFVTRADFKRAGIDHRRWTTDWLEPDLQSGAWRRGPRCPDFAAQHPVVYPQVLNDVRDRLQIPPLLTERGSDA